MKKKLYIILLLCCFILTALIVTHPVYAYKARMQGDYSISCNMQFKDENLGLKVKEETIEFDIDLNNTLFDTVKTQYVVQNTTNDTINTKVYLPLLYYSNLNEENNLEYLEAIKQIEVLNDANSVEYQRRYFIQDVDEILRWGMQLEDTYLQNHFANQNLNWTKYTYQISDLKTNQNDSSYIMNVRLPFDFKGMIFVEGCENISYTRDSDTIYAHIVFNALAEAKTATLSLYTTNQSIEDAVYDAEIYGNGQKIYRIPELIEKENIQFDDIIYAFYDENRGVSRMDWYNAIIRSWEKESYFQSSFRLYNFNQLDIYHKLQSCIEYEIEVGANATVTTQIKIPVKGQKDSGYRPALYRYRYAFLQASYIKEIEKVEIKIKINGYVNEISLGKVSKMGDYYQITLDKIESDNFYFNASLSKTHPITLIAKIFAYIMIGMLTILILIPVLITGIVLLCKRKSNKLQLLMHFLQLIIYVFILASCLIYMIVGNTIQWVLFTLICISLVMLIVEKVITKRKTFGRLSIMGIEVLVIIINSLLFYQFDFETNISTECVVVTYTILLIVATIYNISQCKDQNTNRKQLPSGYLKKSEHIGLILSTSILVITLFIFNQMIQIFSVPVAICIIFSIFIIYLLMYSIVLQLIHQAPFKRFRKNLNITQFEKSMAKKLANLDINDEYRNYLMMLYINHIMLYNKEKASILRMCVTEPKTKAYLPLFDGFSITVITKVNKYNKQVPLLKEKYRKRKLYLKEMNRFDERYQAMTTGVAKRNVDELFNTNTKYEEDNAVYLFQKIFYYYHQGNMTKANEFKEQFMEKYGQLCTLVDIIKDEHYFEDEGTNDEFKSN